TRFLDGVERVRAAGLARDWIGDAEAEPPVREGKDLVRCRRRFVPPGVGDHYNLELESFRGVDGQQSDRVASLLFGDGLELARADRLLVPDKPDEPLDVGSTQLLVRPGEPGEL